MRCATFSKGAIVEGIKINSVGGLAKGVVLGKGPELKTIPLCPNNPPTIKNGKIYSASVSGNGNGSWNGFICANGSCGPNKKRNNKTLLLVKTIYPLLVKGTSDRFGGGWSVSKGNPKILSQVECADTKNRWTETLLVMSPEDIINICYHRQGMKSFFLCYEKTHRDSKLKTHDSIYYLSSLNNRRPRDEKERKLMRKLKEARRS